MAQSRHAQCADECPLLWARRTLTNRVHDDPSGEPALSQGLPSEAEPRRENLWSQRGDISIYEYTQSSEPTLLACPRRKPQGRAEGGRPCPGPAGHRQPVWGGNPEITRKTLVLNGSERRGGIRTHGTVTRTTVFETAPG